MLLLLLLVVVTATPVSFAEQTDPIGASTSSGVVRRQMVRTTAAADAIPVIASYLLGSSLLNLHRVACLPLLLLLPPIPD